MIDPPWTGIPAVVTQRASDPFFAPASGNPHAVKLNTEKRISSGPVDLSANNDKEAPKTYDRIQHCRKHFITPLNCIYREKNDRDGNKQNVYDNILVTPFQGYVLFHNQKYLGDTGGNYKPPQYLKARGK
jgi:hypothetical protein